MLGLVKQDAATVVCRNAFESWGSGSPRLRLGGHCLIWSALLMGLACHGGLAAEPAASPVTSVAPPRASVEAVPGASAAAGGRSAGSTSAEPTAGTELLAADEQLSRAIAAAVEAPDREPADRLLDAGRKPQELLTFAGVRAGMHVAELGAGGGYTTELLARVVGAGGVVYGQNSAFILQRFAEQPWSTRLSKPLLGNVVRVDREFDDPLPPEATALDVVLSVLFYHDTVWFKVDRDRMNRAVFDALKPGGVYVVIDHSARSGDGVTQAEALHRIEENVVRSELERVGFELDAAGDFLRNPADTRDWNASPRAAGERRGSSDRFALRFRKPS